VRRAASGGVWRGHDQGRTPPIRPVRLQHGQNPSDPRHGGFPGSLPDIVDVAEQTKVHQLPVAGLDTVTFGRAIEDA
jgi:hypothetical protein